MILQVIGPSLKVSPSFAGTKLISTSGTETKPAMLIWFPDTGEALLWMARELEVRSTALMDLVGPSGLYFSGSSQKFCVTCQQG